MADYSNPKAVCYSSTWRGLPEGLEHPRHWVMLSAVEISELLATGGFTLPDDVVPDSVRAWRKTQETAADVVFGGALHEWLDKTLVTDSLEEGDAIVTGGKNGPLLLKGSSRG